MKLWKVSREKLTGESTCGCGYENQDCFVLAKTEEAKLHEITGVQ